MGIKLCNNQVKDWFKRIEAGDDVVVLNRETQFILDNVILACVFGQDILNVTLPYK